MIAIVDYRAGNLTSVLLACEKIGASASITSNPRQVLAADRVIFPGVGAAGAAMRNLIDLGLVPVIKDVIRRGTPFLGICVGTQILMDRSEEDGGTETLGIFPGTVKRFTPSRRSDKVPQMGWNNVRQKARHPIFRNVQNEAEFYFVHSYYPAPTDRNCVLAETDYADVVFASVVGRNNVVATQFHTEKSGRVGLQLLKNFIDWQPAREDS